MLFDNTSAMMTWFDELAMRIREEFMRWNWNEKDNVWIKREKESGKLRTPPGWTINVLELTQDQLEKTPLGGKIRWVTELYKYEITVEFALTIRVQNRGGEPKLVVPMKYIKKESLFEQQKG
jgi:hypothetical protein